MKKCIDGAAVLGSTIGIVHPTTRKDYSTNTEGIDRLLGQMGKTLEALLRRGEQYDFKLGFCFDTGHALVSAGEKAMELFRFMKNRVIAFHLDDNAGDRDSHLAPGRGHFFWREFFTELSQMNFENTICVEAPPFDYGPDYSIAAWTTLHGEMCALAEGNP